MSEVMTAKATATGGRDGTVRLSDGKHELDMALPTALGGDGKGTNPEELFAMGYASCFNQAVMVVAESHGVDPSKAEVGCNVTLVKEDGFSLAVELTLAIPGAEPGQVELVLEKAHEMCPYSKATRGNIPVTLTAL